MKKEQKEKLPENAQSTKKPLTKDEQKICREFTEYRHRYGMSQKKWAKAVGISYGLVKRIETQTIACSKKTMTQVQQFMNSCDIRPDSHDLHNLEEHVIYDVFLTNMGQLTKKDASKYAGRCTRALRETLSRASGCTSPAAQEKYYEFVDMFLKVLSIAADDSIEIINNGTDVSAIGNNLAAYTKKLIAKISPPEGTGRTKGRSEAVQISLMDLGVNENNP